MEEMAARELRKQAYEAKVAEHEEWLQTTWAGFAIRQLQAVGTRVAPFFQKMADVLRRDAKTPMDFVISLFLRAIFISIFVLTFYAVFYVLNMFLGQEIVLPAREEPSPQYQSEGTGPSSKATEGRRKSRDKKDK